MNRILTLIVLLGLFWCSQTKSAQAVLIEYIGDNGLSATGKYSLIGQSTLQILLTNTSVDPYGGGGANMVLSSLNFNLGGINITGGSVTLPGVSIVVENDKGTWFDITGSTDLNDEWAYSNHGIGNGDSGSLSNPFPDALNAITAHSNGGNKVTTFNGTTGLPGGLDFGGVAVGSDGFGSHDYILDSVLVNLTLDDSLLGLDFLENGSYVEFGSDYAYVPGVVIPEPATLFLMGSGLLSGAIAFGRRRRKS